MNKSVEYYMSLPYKISVYPDEDGKGFVAEIADLPGCLTSADSIEELWQNIEEAKQLWFEVALEDGDYIPEPSPVEIEEYSGKFVVRIPRSLHRQLSYRAKLENTSLNQMVISIMSESMGRWQVGRHPYSAYEVGTGLVIRSWFETLIGASEKSLVSHKKDWGQIAQPSRWAVMETSPFPRKLRKEKA